MLRTLLYAALVRFLAPRITEVDPDTVTRTVRAFRRASRGAPWIPIATGLGIGLAAGTALGVLFAPRSGAQTRSLLGDRLRSYAKAGGVDVEAQTQREADVPSTGEQRGFAGHA